MKSILIITQDEELFRRHVGAAISLLGRDREEPPQVLIEPAHCERCLDVWYPGQPERAKQRSSKKRLLPAYAISDASETRWSQAAREAATCLTPARR